MFNIEDLQEYFDEIVEANSTTIQLSYQKTFKYNGKIKVDFITENIELREVESLFDFFEVDIEEVDYYPKTLLKKIFNIKQNKLKLEGDESNFVMVSEKTLKDIDTNCKIFTIPQDNIIVFGKRSRLIIYQEGSKTYVNTNRSNYKIYQLK